MRAHHDDAGFTLVELMLALVIIGILAAIAVPGLARARRSSLEASTMGSLRAIATAQVSYSNVCGGGFHAPSLSWLARPPVGGGESFISPDFNSDTLVRHSYRIRFRRGDRATGAPPTCNGLRGGRTVQNYFVGANPLEAGVVDLHFATNSSGAIYQSPRRIPSFFSGVPPPPARLIE